MAPNAQQLGALATCALKMAGAQFQAKNKPVDMDSEVPEDREFDVEDRQAVRENVHVLILALDYKGTGHELTCTMDGNNFSQLCQTCGVQDVEKMYDNMATKENVKKKVKEMSSRVKPDDYFIFYYSGHGSQVADRDGDEDEGKDECLCTVGPNGELAGEYFMTDDEIVDLLTSSFKKSVRQIIICDCCHSGTMTDMGNKKWKGREACSMSGCQDDQTSGDMGKGGIFTHSLLLALDDIVNSDGADEEITCALVYNTTLHEDDKVFNSAQDIAIACPKTTKPNAIAWPLVPPEGYKAPLRRAAGQLAAASPANGGGNVGAPPSAQLQMVGQQFGLNPQVLAMLSNNQLNLDFLQNPQVKQFLEQLPQIQGVIGSMFGEQYRPDHASQLLTGSRVKDMCAIQ
eukprot:TRINITY_DN75940_c0_g1_i1.p1 TRINITY_DN75940_c0_g1~~TRINITY_DN75940_c0_g1_i1.p1  ORF type:complete len:424 (+),score=107.80 TRINITY_DN75940_c0_g1_i1:72-1274(+)